ncbi:hypothetical protein AZF37_02965 [endosymbiont 'TC1' of Trimyema compressum]|nr:hypothetical protein AZF37_02965 [endosymbiont 'TC1' of Trimyema compressum]
MPILNVDEAPETVICNFDTKPGYAGVDNPLYEKEEGVTLLLGDAKETLKKLLFVFAFYKLFLIIIHNFFLSLVPTFLIYN